MLFTIASFLGRLAACPVCKSEIEGKRKFCSRACLREGYRLGIVINSGNFKPGSVSLNKGRTLESWVGTERAAIIKEKMSINSRKKAVLLRTLNDNPAILAKRQKSRRFHEEVVSWLATRLKGEGHRVFILSEYVKEKRTPDAIVFDGKELIALEVETEKRWKPSHSSTEDRLTRLNAKSGFFDRTVVVFPALEDSIDVIGPEFLSAIFGKERLNRVR